MKALRMEGGLKTPITSHSALHDHHEGTRLRGVLSIIKVKCTQGHFSHFWNPVRIQNFKANLRNV